MCFFNIIHLSCLTWALPSLLSGDPLWIFHDGKLFHSAPDCFLTEGKECEPLICFPDHELRSHVRPEHQCLPLHLQNNSVQKNQLCWHAQSYMRHQRTWRHWKGISFFITRLKPFGRMDINITISKILMHLKDKSLSKSVITRKVNIYIENVFIKFHRENIKTLVIMGDSH